MNKVTRDRIYKALSSLQGEYCKMCGKLPNETIEKQLIVDHKDNDNSNNNFSNLQILCRSCNYTKNPHKNLEQIIEERTQSAEMKKNGIIEPRFRLWLIGIIEIYHKVPYEEAINSGAEVVNGSTESIKRYIRKMTSKAGAYEIVTGQQGRPFIQKKE